MQTNLTLNKQLKIAILGEMRSGKDTVANFIKKLEKNKTINFAFSEGIHHVIKITMPEIYETGKPRKELQQIGQFMRSLKSDVWIDYVFNSDGFDWASKRGHNLVFTDVRQPNEVARLKEKGFTILKLESPVDVRIERVLSLGDSFESKALSHETELVVGQLPYDYKIVNDGSLGELEQKVALFLSYVRRGDR